ncbi:PGRMC1_2 [Lepeophtheirus salmonis]|uniref:PGRMC1_2 n=1 Tax=Lepeophtheirus salmonis TaxID=72036 RepID=A0A7R8D0P0_LEPSM|nr:PGRMC1_2 [Lepeophtheirus salmonis]CAF2984167.1 PGRMC1_2 [Lepeophtheirus salmonis]
MSSAPPSFTQSEDPEEMSYSTWMILHLTDPIKVTCILLILWLIKKIFRREDSPLHPIPLKEYDGTKEDGRILIAVNRKVYDVTKGRHFYGKDGPYGNLAGHDASRALAKFEVNNVSDEYDDLSDLGQEDMDEIPR